MESIGQALAGLAFETRASCDGIPSLEIAPKLAREACARLRDAGGFETCTLVTAVDRFPAEPRFEVVWQLLCVARSERVRLKARVAIPRTGSARVPDTEAALARVPDTEAALARVPSTEAALARVPSIVDLFPGAAFFERECYDMFGIEFDGHAGLRRLLMPDDYGHFPLRKDFPHLGIEPDRLYREWDRRRHEKALREAAP